MEVNFSRNMTLKILQKPEHKGATLLLSMMFHLSKGNFANKESI